MNEIIITIMLIIPPASQGVYWDIGEIHNQLQVTFKSGVQATLLFKCLVILSLPNQDGQSTIASRWGRNLATSQIQIILPWFVGLGEPQ